MICKPVAPGFELIGNASETRFERLLIHTGAMGFEKADKAHVWPQSIVCFLPATSTCSADCKESWVCARKEEVYAAGCEGLLIVPRTTEQSCGGCFNFPGAHAQTPQTTCQILTSPRFCRMGARVERLHLSACQAHYAGCHMK